MDREQTAIFIGHRDCVALKPQRLEDAIIKHMEQGVRLFLAGGMGRYDEMCASVVHRLKQLYPGTRSELVIPNFIYLYISLKNAVFTRFFALWRFGYYAIFTPFTHGLV